MPPVASHRNKEGKAEVQTFIVSVMVAVGLALVAAFVLVDFVQQPADVAFATSGVRLGPADG